MTVAGVSAFTFTSAANWAFAGVSGNGLTSLTASRFTFVCTSLYTGLTVSTTTGATGCAATSASLINPPDTPKDFDPENSNPEEPLEDVSPPCKI